MATATAVMESGGGSSASAAAAGRVQRWRAAIGSSVDFAGHLLSQAASAAGGAAGGSHRRGVSGSRSDGRGCGSSGLLRQLVHSAAAAGCSWWRSGTATAPASFIIRSRASRQGSWWT